MTKPIALLTETTQAPKREFSDSALLRKKEEQPKRKELVDIDALMR